MLRAIGIFVLTIAVFAFSTRALADDSKKDGREVDVPRSKLPEKVAKAALDALPGGKIEDIDKETKDGKTTWELGVAAGGKDYAVVVDDDGKVLSKVEKKEEKLKVGDVPGTVVDGVKKEFPGAKITSALKLIKGDATSYELVVDVDKKTWEIVVSLEGKVVSKAEVKEEEEKK